MSNKQYVSRDLKARRQRNVFNLSQRQETSAPFGMLVPCFVKQVIPDSKFEISLENQTTARPLVTRSFARMREHFDYFFVPLSQLWKQFDNFISQQSNVQSSTLKYVNQGKIPSVIPYIDAERFSQDILQSQVSEVDIAGYNLKDGLKRIAEYLEYGKLALDGAYPSVRVNLFNALAYQKIYYDFYRNDYYEAYNTEAFNIDDQYSDMSQTLGTLRLESMFTPHYRLRKKDYFTRVTPDVLPNSTLDNFLGFLDSASYSHDLDNSNFIPFNINGSQGNSNQKIVDQVNSSSDPSSSNVAFGSDVRFPIGAFPSTYQVNGLNSALQPVYSTAYHKFAAAREAYLKRIFAAKRNYNSVMQAIFGVSPDSQRSDRVYHLGGFSQVLSIDGINNQTASGENAVLPTGQVNFYLNNSKKLKFHAKEHGILMCIYSTSIENDYRPYRIDRMNFRSVPEDFFNPFYENIGKQALYAAEYNYDNGIDEPSNIDKVRILGFVDRYSDYKESVDVVHGALATPQLAYFSVFKNQLRDLTKPLYLKDLIESPEMVVNIFAGAEYASTPDGDHFYLNMYHKVKMIAPMQPLNNF